VEKHHSGRIVTIVQPHDLIKNSVNLPSLTHSLKRGLGTGGEVEGDRIVLHGDHRDQVKKELVRLGILLDNIEVI